MLEDYKLGSPIVDKLGDKKYRVVRARSVEDESNVQVAEVGSAGLICEENGADGKRRLYVDPDNVEAFLKSDLVRLPLELTVRSKREILRRDTPYDWQFYFEGEALEKARRAVYGYYLIDELRGGIQGKRDLRGAIDAISMVDLKDNLFLLDRALTAKERREALAPAIFERLNMNPENVMAPTRVLEEYAGLSVKDQEFFAENAYIFLDAATNLHFAKLVIRHNSKHSEKLPEIRIRADEEIGRVSVQPKTLDSREVKKLQDETIKLAKEENVRLEAHYRGGTDALNTHDKAQMKLDNIDPGLVSQLVNVSRWRKQKFDSLVQISEDLDLMPRPEVGESVLVDTARFVNTLQMLSRIQAIRDTYEQRRVENPAAELTDQEYEKLGHYYYDLVGVQQSISLMEKDESSRDLVRFTETMNRCIESSKYNSTQFDSDEVDVSDLITARIDDIMLDGRSEKTGVFRDKQQAADCLQMLEWSTALAVVAVAAHNPTAFLVRRENEQQVALDALHKVANIKDDHFAVSDAENNYPFRPFVYDLIKSAESAQRMELVLMGRIKDDAQIPGVELNKDKEPASKKSKDIISRYRREATYRADIGPENLNTIRSKLVANSPLLKVEPVNRAVSSERVTKELADAGKVLARAG